MKVNPIFQRLSLLTGAETVEALERIKVLVFGLGGVGSWCAEALVRSGIGHIVLVDSDRVCVTNINRQVQATTRTVGFSKVEVLAGRLREINPGCTVEALEKVFSRNTAGEFDIKGADYVIDAIDSLTHKLDLIELASQAGVIPVTGAAGAAESTGVTPVTLYSSMGTALKLDPTQLKTADIWETRGCPLARLVRSGLRKRGFRGHFTVVYSTERLPLHREIGVSCGSAQCLCPRACEERASGEGVEWCATKKVINGSAVTVTAAAGMILASLVIRDIHARYGRPPEPNLERTRFKDAPAEAATVGVSLS
ncbi:MAG: tRNA threonylcarbamoyladenosine dehydratase [Spirochaetaceae bacterium]|jgi:tRNA A37 threonylcarbamoyladenosine dehydratase|nr:tRNA threonylcarbamoyladenosine dehydratase [Spirochaetaceae bacterium]